MLCYGLLVVLWCADPAPVVVPPRCPPLVAYDRRAQQAAAAAMRALPSASPLRGMVADYGTLRARCRAYERR